MKLTDYEIFRIVRRRLGYSQTDFAGNLDTHQSVVSMWETGVLEIPEEYMSEAEKFYSKIELLDRERAHIIRRRAGLSLNQAAHLMHVTPFTIIKKERGDSPCEEYLQQLSEVYKNER